MDVLRGNLIILTSLIMIVVFWGLWVYKLRDYKLRSRFCLYRKDNLHYLLKRGTFVTAICIVLELGLHGLVAWLFHGSYIGLRGICYVILLFMSLCSLFIGMLMSTNAATLIGLIVMTTNYCFFILFMIIVKQWLFDDCLWGFALVLLILTVIISIQIHFDYRRWDMS